MEVALRRRLAGVADVSISQSQQTAAVTFVSGTHEFSAAAFREAVAEADVEVLSLEVDVCGVIDAENVLRSVGDVNRPLVRLQGGNALSASVVCVSGRLDEPVEPYETHVLVVRARS
jgi:hypothetical protein